MDHNKKIGVVAVIAVILIATVAVFVFFFVRKVEAPAEVPSTEVKSGQEQKSYRHRGAGNSRSFYKGGRWENSCDIRR